MKCNRCQREISEDESYSYLSETLCDDCYMDAMSPAKACDPWAVYLATHTRDSTGLKGTEGLTSFQKKVYELIKSRGKISPAEVMANFDITQRELENVVATLRHCEMVRGQKEGNEVYLVPF